MSRPPLHPGLVGAIVLAAGGLWVSLPAAPVDPPAAATAAASAASAASRVADIVGVAPGVHLLPGRFDPGRQPDGNSLLLEGPGGLVIVDTGRHAEHTGALLEWSRRQGVAIAAVINTHWHLDHIGGNAMLKRAQPGLPVYASTAVALALAGRMAQSADELQAVIDNPQTDAASRDAARIDLALLQQRTLLEPDHRIESEAEDLVLAGRRLRVGVERGAVSGGDVWVLDRDSGILAAGDFVTLPVPFLDTACTPAWRSAMARLEALPFSRLVPGHGPVMSRADFVRYRGAFDRLLDCAAGDTSPAACSAGWTADLGPLLPAEAQRQASAMLGYYIGQHLRAAPAQRDRWCLHPVPQ